MTGEQEESDDFSVVLFKYISDREEVALRLGHLLVVDRDVSVVHPVVGELDSVVRLTLSDLVLVVRELEVLAACVDVKRIAEVLSAHRRALDVPARTAHAPGRLPCDLVFFFSGLPESEVERILFLFFYHDAGSGFEVIDVLTRKFSVVLELSCAVVNVAVDFVSISLIDQVLNELDDVVHRLRYSRVYVSRSYVDSACILEVFFDVLFADFGSCDALFSRAVDDLVVYVREVLYERYIISFVLEILSHRVEYYERAGVSDMEKVIYGRAADVHLDFAFLLRYELFLLS